MRLGFNIAIIVSILYLPWWIGALLVIAGCLFVDCFFEAVIYGILTDSLYVAHFGFHFAVTLYCVVVFGIVSIIRPRLAWK